MGTQFVAATALAGDDFATFPDYPAEIRAPAGTTFGVSAYQIHLGARPITTAGDAPHVLVAFNPAALKVNLPLIADGALIVLNIDSFTSRGLAKAGYETIRARAACSTAIRSSRSTSRSTRSKRPQQFGLEQERRRPLQEFLGARSRAVDVQPRRRLDRGMDRTRSSRKTRRFATRTWRRCAPATPMARPPS